MCDHPRDIEARNIVARNIVTKCLRSKHIKSRNIETENLQSKNITSDIITATTLNATTVNSDIVNGKTVNSDIINGKTVNSDIVNAKTVNSDIVNAKTVTVDSLTVKNFTNFPFQNYTFNVGPNRDFKTIKEVLNLLSGKVALGIITINIDAGTYDGISTSGLTVLNGANVNFFGDRRTIAGLTYTNNLTGNYYTFVTIPQGSNTLMQIVDDVSGETENLQSYGLVVGDKVSIYSNDTTIPKQERFITANVIAVDATSFTIDVSVSFPAENNTITFHPNVYIKCNSDLISITPQGQSENPFKGLSNLLVSVNSSFNGFTLLPADEFSNNSSIRNLSTSSSFVNMLVLGTKYMETTVGSTEYKGFTNPSAYVDTAYGQINFENFTVLGTGYNPLTSGVGPISINNSPNAIITSLYIAGAIENKDSDGILYIFNSMATLNDIFITGNEDAVGLFLSKSSAYYAFEILIAEGVLGILVTDDSSIDFHDSYVENCDTGIEVSKFSKAIFTNLTLYGNTQDFCTKDTSQIMRDDVVIVAPPCL